MGVQSDITFATDEKFTIKMRENNNHNKYSCT